MRTRTLPLLRLSFKRWMLLLAVVGIALLVLPWRGCGSALVSRADEPLAAPADTLPQLDDEELARDAAAVSAAQAALAAWRPAAAPKPTARPAATTGTRTVSAADPQEVTAAQRRVDVAQDDVDADQAELDRLLAEQESSSDPASYDGDVAAAREELEASHAALAEAEQDLATAKGRTRTVTTTASPAPRATATASTGRAELVAALADARAQQTAHLAARQKAVADWRSAHQAALTRVATHNAHVTECASRTAVPGVLGSAALLLAAAGTVAHTVRGRLTH